jgi:hypothetical protein
MIAYNWNIENLDHRTFDGFVCCVHWRCTAQDGEYSASVYGTVGFEDATPKIAYDNLTPAEVLGWIWGKEEGVDKDAIESQLATQIDALKNPVQESGVPW